MSNDALVFRIAQELSGQWTVPILLELEACGGRFTPIQRRLGIAPARLNDNLKRMEQNGLLTHLSPIERRHPLLPEYVLTGKGLLHREAARAVQAAESELGQGRLSAKAWNMPVLLSLDFEYDRFQEIRNALQDITPRMLSTRLEELSTGGLVDKRLVERPRPSFLYHLHRSAKQPVHQLATDLTSLV